jgi:hypothetical protein
LAEEKRSIVQLAEMLASVPLFSGLGKKDLERLAAAGREAAFEASLH